MNGNNQRLSCRPRVSADSVMDLSQFDRRPIVVAIAGPDGAGKATFFHAHLAQCGLRFVNADVLATELAIGSYKSATLADALRRQLCERGQSFIFETVFPDPVGEKIAFLEEAAGRGYEIVVCFIGLADGDQSIERVSMRVSQGGHDVPEDKLRSRFRRTLGNLQAAILRLPSVLVYDNSDLRHPFRHVGSFDHGNPSEMGDPIPNGCCR